MKNWKTSLFGIIFGVAGLIGTGTIETTPQIEKIAAAVSLIAGAAGFNASKDKDVTGAGPTATRISGRSYIEKP